MGNMCHGCLRLYVDNLEYASPSTPFPYALCSESSHWQADEKRFLSETDWKSERSEKKNYCFLLSSPI